MRKAIRLRRRLKKRAVVSKGERDVSILTRNSVQGLDRLEVPFVWARRVVVVVLLLDAGRRVAVGLVHGWMRRGERGRAE
jgi:hypothetical protein